MSRNRTYIDTVIIELRATFDASNHNGHAPQVDTDTGEIFDSPGDENPIPQEDVEKTTYLRIEKAIRELLAKLNDSTDFTYADLMIHAGEHTMVSQIAGLRVRSEGNYLVVGEDVYQKIDPKDALSLAITLGAQKLLSGEMKLTSNAWTNMMALLWRMSGNAGADEFIQAMIEKTQSTIMNSESPLGASYLERQTKLAQKQIRIQKEEQLAQQESENAADG